MTVQYATCSYPEFAPHMGIPVRATVGAPRYRLNYILGGAMPQAAPERWFMGREYGPFRQAMRDKLDQLGIERFTEIAQSIANEHGQPDGTVVFLCFENGINEKGWCHRRMVSAFLEENGHACPELGSLSSDDPSLGEVDPPPFEAIELW